MSEDLRPQFSKHNPYWHADVVIGKHILPRNNRTNYLAAMRWEAWGVGVDNTKMALRIAFTRGELWKKLWVNQVRSSLRWTARTLLKESRGEARLSKAVPFRSEIQSPVEAPG